MLLVVRYSCLLFCYAGLMQGSVVCINGRNGRVWLWIVSCKRSDAVAGGQKAFRPIQDMVVTLKGDETDGKL